MNLKDFYKFYAAVISNCSKQRQNIFIFFNTLIRNCLQEAKGL